MALVKTRLCADISYNVLAMLTQFYAAYIFYNNGYCLCSLWMYQQSWKRVRYFIPHACVHVKGLK